MLRPDANSAATRKRIESHTFADEEGEEYEGSNYGGYSDYFRRKKIKLQNLDAELRSSSSEKPQIFRGVVAHVNGYTQPSLNDLHRLVVTHGGGFMQYLDGKTTVTHIIASSLTLKKQVEFRRYRIVKPIWVVESVKAGRLLPWDNYRVVDEGKSQKVLGSDNGKVVSQVSSSQIGYKEQTRDSWYTEQLKDHFSGPTVDHGYAEAGEEDELMGDVDSDDAIKSHEDLSRKSTRRQLEVEFSTTSGGEMSRTSRRRCSPHSLGNISSDSEAQLTDDSPRGRAGNVQGANHDRPDLSEKSSFDAESNSDGIKVKETALGNEQVAMLGANPQTSRIALCKSDASTSKTSAMTAEEHNSVLLSDPRIRRTSVLNPDFLKQYYSESRLHHLSTWKAELRAQLQQLTAEKSPSQNARQKRPPGSRRYIFHVDFDCFFAAVSLKSLPEYKDKPVVIAHGSGSGSEIASCNYPARKFGVKNGMWMKQAQQLCPEIKVLPYDFKAYEEASRGFYDAILVIDGVVQSVSIDEALIDVTFICVHAGGSEGRGLSEGSIWREQAKADELAQNLRDQVKSKTQCDVSVGIGGNILLAKVALRKAKPAGQYQIKPEEVLDFIGDLTVQDLPGVAYSIGAKLEDIGVKFVKDIRNVSKEKLMSALGPKTGEKIWDYARGVDRTEVGDVVIRKSVSAEVNWGVRFENQEQAEEFLHNLSGELHRRLVENKVKGRHLTMKIMRRAADAPLDPPKHMGHGKCDLFNKSTTLGVATNTQDIISKEAISILRSFGFSPGELRGIGIQMTRLELLKEGHLESSQRILQFKTERPNKEPDDPIVDDVVSPPRRSYPPHPASLTTTENVPKSTAKLVPLNTLGTQFIIPSQVDPAVVAELPEDIRLKITGSTRYNFPAVSLSPQSYQSPTPAAFPKGALPTASQLDPETLDALPPDIRDEVLSFYGQKPSPLKTRSQTSIPQSPRKSRGTLPKPDFRKPPTPTKKPRAGASSSKGKSRSDNNFTLTQSAFILPRATATRKPAAQAPPDDGDNEDDMDPEFLAALPEDIRAEVLEEHRRTRLRKKANLDLSRRRKPAPPPAAPSGQRRLRLPPPPQKPTFTAERLSSLPELRDVIKAWQREFWEEGPYIEDVQALGRYLARVVKEERDLGKAVGVVRWVGWIVQEAYEDGKPPPEGKGGWEKAAEALEDAVQEAVRERGLGKVAI